MERAERGADERRARGARGEALVARYLLARGFRLAETGYRCRYGEIDIVAWDGGTLCFVEVKARANSMYALPREAVTPAKQRKLRLTAAHYLASHGIDAPARFDVAEVYDDGAAPPRITYLKSAFA